MTVFVDTEFNGFDGPMISFALVSDRGGELYGVRRLPDRLNPWVKANVVPVLNQASEPDEVLRRKLAVFLEDHKGETLVADWPLDFSHLLGFMCPGDRKYGPGDLMMRLVPQQELPSLVPHNALSDARALMEMLANGQVS